jgi:hypothetical protein
VSGNRRAGSNPASAILSGTGPETQFTNALEPDARSRLVFSLHRPEELVRPAGLDDQLRGLSDETLAILSRRVNASGQVRSFDAARGGCYNFRGPAPCRPPRILPDESTPLFFACHLVLVVLEFLALNARRRRASR